MTRRFIVGINNNSTAAEQKIVEYLKTNGFGWWHWLDNFWLVVDVQNKLSVDKLRDDLRLISPDTTMLIIETKDRYLWSGFGPNAPERNMFDWLNKTWDIE